MKRLLLPLLFLIPLGAGALELEVPVACEMNKECFVQNYVDTDAGPAHFDFQCGNMTYNGHDGTDFRVRDFVAMEQGVNVIAAAPGTVLGMRNDVEDAGAEAVIPGKECGNGVMLQHGDGWQTQYCHMKKGSVKVVKGQQVNTGDVLGQVGYSGKTAFPHLHLTVRHNGTKLDPFTGKEASAALCSADTTGSLWSPAAKAALPYSPTHLLGIGMTGRAPDKEGARRGKFTDADMLLESPLLLLWADVMGVQTGDMLKMQIFEPSGQPIVDKEEVFAQSKVLQFYYVGSKRTSRRWIPGQYRGRVALYREGKEVFSAETNLVAKP